MDNAYSTSPGSFVCSEWHVVHPAAARRLLVALRFEQEMESLAAIFESDPGLAAHLFRWTNHSDSRDRAVTTVAQALDVVEPAILRAASLGLLARTTYLDEQSPTYFFWRDSCRRSTLAARLVDYFPSLDADQMRLIGLLASTVRPGNLEGTFTHWNFPSSLTDVVKDGRSGTEPTTDAGRVLYLADLLVQAAHDPSDDCRHFQEVACRWLGTDLPAPERWLEEVDSESESSGDDLHADRLRVEAHDLIVEISLAHSKKLADEFRRAEVREQEVEKLRQERDGLQRQVLLDPLLGIGNRRHFDVRLAEEWKRSLRNGQPLALILFDIDHFKHLNDTYRHQAGDHVLRVVAETMRDCLRSSDIFARYGGEEFAVICPETDEAGAAALAERMRYSLQELVISHRGNRLSTTASFGVASVVEPLSVNDIEEIVDSADRYLFEAKRGGRNRVQQGICPHPDLARERFEEAKVEELRLWSPPSGSES